MKQQLQTGTLMTLIVLGLLLAGVIIYKLAALILLMLIAGVLACGISPFVQRLERYMPRYLAAIIILLTAALVIAGTLTVLGFTAVQEGSAFVQHDWPKLETQLEAVLSNLHARYPIIPDADALRSRVNGASGQIITYLWSTSHMVVNFIGSLLSMLLVVIFTLFFTVYRSDIKRSILLLVPPNHHEKFGGLMTQVVSKLGGWLRGELVLVAIMITLITVGMTLLGVRYSYFVGIVGGIGEVLPFFGPGAAMVPAIAIGLATGMSMPKLIGIAIFFIALTQIENYVIFPRVMEKHLELSPLTTILALLAGGTLLGVVGAVLAVPLAAAGRVIMLEAVVPAIQGQPAEAPGTQEPPGKTKKKKRRAESPPATNEEAMQHIARLGQAEQPISAPADRV
jgi:predicted PurR-regulated permease PerM